MENNTLVILESPYAGNVEKNIEYARECLRDSLLRDEAPIASHLLYTQDGVLDDLKPNERKMGIDAGLAWKKVAEKHVFYIDYGMSSGMKYAEKNSKLQIVYRKIKYIHSREKPYTKTNYLEN